VSDRLFTLRIDTSGLAESVEEVQRLRGGLANRKHLHAKIAVDAAAATRNYLTRQTTHVSAQRLGAKPTGHRLRAARGIEADSTAGAAVLRIPRTSGLQRAFGDILIRPGSGKRFLTIPADKRTYGRRAGEFPEGTFRFAVSMERRTLMLVFADGSGVAYFLKSAVLQKQDRGLLPSDKDYRAIARNSTRRYIDELLDGKGGPA
jgi:hypothetical protein